jgi:hypothetical protein
MERLPLILALAAGAPAVGCIHVHTDAGGKVKSVEMKLSNDPPAPPADGDVRPAAAAVAAPAVATAARAAVAKLTPAAGQPVEFAVTWQPRLAQLPDPTRAGTYGTGLVGQMFLYGAGPKMPFAQADGRLTIELFDESRPGPEPVRLGSWTFEKDVLRRLVMQDERFGKCYALFLPWPSYHPGITRVKLATRFEPDNGFPLYAPPATLTIDTTTPGTGEVGAVATTRPVTPPGPPAGPGPGAFPAAPPVGPPPAFGPSIPMPGPTPGGGPTAFGGGPLAPAGGPPPGLPPIAVTLPTR